MRTDQSSPLVRLKCENWSVWDQLHCPKSFPKALAVKSEDFKICLLTLPRLFQDAACLAVRPRKNREIVEVKKLMKMSMFENQSKLRKLFCKARAKHFEAFANQK